MSKITEKPDDLGFHSLDSVIMTSCARNQRFLTRLFDVSFWFWPPSFGSDSLKMTVKMKFDGNIMTWKTFQEDYNLFRNKIDETIFRVHEFKRLFKNISR